MQAALLTIGDELLIGQVLDTNTNWIASYLYEHGIELASTMIVSDDKAAIDAALSHAAMANDVILLTGGLGPTNDDITLEALAEHLDLPLTFNEVTYARIEHIFNELIKRPLSPAHKRQAFQPQGAEALHNAQGTAPGIWIEKNGVTYIAMPGVPREMKYLMTEEVVPKLLPKLSSKVRKEITIHTAGWGETQIATEIESVEENLPAHIKLAYLPSLGTVRVRINAEGENGEVLQKELEEVKTKIINLLPEDLIFGFGKTSLVEIVQELLLEKKLTLVTAESCSGGKVANLITELPGASRVFYGSVIAYDNSIKEKLLGVPKHIFEQHGAVSEQAVCAMIEGVIPLLGADVAIATSGIAGPSGGTAKKPVGTIWVAVGSKDKIITRKLAFKHDRKTNIDRTANTAIDMLRRFLVKA
ncbi:MAG: CinA family nicotinamide mononucleotide deamidase-related protein [Saprospiraceae bacterium]